MIEMTDAMREKLWEDGMQHLKENQQPAKAALLPIVKQITFLKSAVMEGKVKDVDMADFITALCSSLTAILSAEVATMIHSSPEARTQMASILNDILLNSWLTNLGRALSITKEEIEKDFADLSRSARQ